MSEIDGLREEVAALRREVAELRAALLEARGRVQLTMRAQSRCPGCGGRELRFVSELLDRGHGNQRYPLAISVNTRVFKKDDLFGRLQMYVCVGCGLAECYVEDPAKVPVDGDKVEKVEVPEEGGPYR